MIRTCRDCVHLRIQILPVTKREIATCGLGHYNGKRAPASVEQWYSMRGISRGAQPTREIARTCKDRQEGRPRAI